MTQSIAPATGRHGRPAARFDQPRFDQPLFERPPSDGASTEEVGGSPAAGGPGAPAEGAGGCLFAWGERPSFVRTAEDVARASGRRFRPLPGIGPGRRTRRTRSRPVPVLPVFGSGDALVLEAEAVPELVAGLERILPTRPPGAVVVVGHEGGTDPWRAAEMLVDWAPSPDVVQFPQGRGWLADRLSPVSARAGRNAVVGVVGAGGGIGTSTLTLWLAARAAEDGQPVVVVDAVGTGTGLDTCVFPGTEPGLRRDELGRLPTMPAAGDLLSALPAPHGLPILTSSAAPGGGTADPGVVSGPVCADAEPVHEHWAATETLSEVVVPFVDLGAAHGLMSPHRVESQWIPRCTVLVLLVPFTLRGLCQARSAVAQWAPLVPLVPIGVGPRACDVSAAEAGAAIGAPLRAVVPPVGAVCEAAEEGRLLEAGYRRRLRRPIADAAAAVFEAIAASRGTSRGRPGGQGSAAAPARGRHSAQGAGA